MESSSVKHLTLLTTEQHQQLREFIKQDKPNWEISEWLRQECHLSFREASDVRHEAMMEHRTNYAETQKKALASVARDEDWPQAPTPPQSESTTPITDSIKEATEEEACVTCRSPGFLCDCKVKLVAEIPF